MTGGGSNSAIWRQIAADVFGVSVVGLATAEGASLGAAIQVAHADGKGSYEQLCNRLVSLDESTRCEPSSESAGIYREKLDRQIQLTTVLRDAGML